MQLYEGLPLNKRFCECGCGTIINRINNGRITRFVRFHHLNKNIIPKIFQMTPMRPCSCGYCDDWIPTISRLGRPVRFKRGHHSKQRNKINPELVQCACGCGELILSITRRNNTRRYKHGHGGHKTMFKKGNIPPYSGRKLPMWIRKILSQAHADDIPRFESNLEKIVRNELTRIGIKFKKHKSFHIKNFHHQVDIFIEPNICVECDGEYWHSQLVGRRYKYYIPINRDYIIDSELEKIGMKVIRLWGYDINNNLDWCLNLIKSFMSNQEQ